MEAVKEILRAEGVDVDSLEINEPLEYSRDDYYDLVIEKIGENRLSVGQYYTQHMDLMHAPEVVFDTTGDEWTPVEYTNHDTVPQVYDADETGVEGLDQLLETWNRNLQNQFPAEEVVGGTE